MGQFQILLRQKNNPMNIESQCVSLELAKQLKEAGVPQSSLFYWVDIPVITPPQYELVYKEKLSHPLIDIYNGYSAFTCSELGEMLPTYLDKYEEDPCDYYLEIGHDSYGWYVVYRYQDESGGSIDKTEIIRDENEANSRAKMLLYLIQNNLINSSTISDGDK